MTRKQLDSMTQNKHTGIKFFANTNHEELESEINKFLANISSEDVIDIKFTPPKEAGEKFTSLVIYRKYSAAS